MGLGSKGCIVGASKGIKLKISKNVEKCIEINHKTPSASRLPK